jgi:myosin heavy subunit
MATSELILSIIDGLGLLGGSGYGIKAWYERKLLRANASSTDATATAVLVAAARELVDPLRVELAQERKDHAEEVEMERRKLAQVREQLDRALDDSRQLARELHQAREEMARLQAENLTYRKMLADIEESNG